MTPQAKKWLRNLTAALMVAVLAVVIVIGFQRSQRMTGPVGNEMGPDVVDQADDPAIGVYKGFEYIESVAGTSIFALRSIRTLGKSSGWHEIEGVQLQLFEEGEKGPIVTANGASFNIQTRDARLRGPIVVTFPSGATLTTQTGHFDASSRRFVTDSEVLFMSGDTVAEAGRAMYLLAGDRVVLEEDAIVTSGGTSLLAPTIHYDRDDHRIRFPEGTRIVQGRAWIAAPYATVELSGPDGKPERIELAGGVDAFHPGNPDGGAVEARAERVSGVMDARGHWQLNASTQGAWIEFTTRFGSTFFERRIQTQSLRGVIGPDGPINLRTERSTCIREIPFEGDPRYAEARSAKVWFAGGRASDLELDDNVVIRAEGLVAKGHRARFAPSAGVTLLHGDPTGPERALVTSDRGRVTSDQVQIFDLEERLEARGNVQGQLQDVALLGADENQAEEVMHFAAEVLHIRENGDVFELRDGARVWQGHRLLIADTVTYTSPTEAVLASGHVRVTFPGDQLGTQTANDDDVVVISRSLRYDRPGRTATFKGNVRYSDPEHTLSASELVVRFDDEDTVTEIDAIGNVELEELITGRTMVAHQATRNVADGTVQATGEPVRLTDADGTTVSSSSLTWNQADGSVTVAGGTETVYYPEEEP
jgi:lipopolysaccharide export system protein LptA